MFSDLIKHTGRKSLFTDFLLRFKKKNLPRQNIFLEKLLNIQTQAGEKLRKKNKVQGLLFSPEYLVIVALQKCENSTSCAKIKVCDFR